MLFKLFNRASLHTINSGLLRYSSKLKPIQWSRTQILSSSSEARSNEKYKQYPEFKKTNSEMTLEESKTISSPSTENNKDENSHNAKKSIERSTELLDEWRDERGQQAEQIDSALYEEVDLMDYINRTEDMDQILVAIKPYADQITSEDLFTILHRINFVCFKYRQRRADHYEENRFAKLMRIVQSSPVMHSLFDRTVELIDELDTSCLTQLIDLFAMIKQDPKSQVMRLAVDALRKRLSGADLHEILKAMASLIRYSMKANCPTDQSIKQLNSSLMEIVKERILENQFDRTDLELLRKCFEVFLSLDVRECADLRVVDRVSECILLPQNKLNFKQAVRLLRSIEISRKNYMRNSRLPAQLVEVNEKCNSVIAETFAQQPSRLDALYYAFNLHRYKTKPDYEVDNFYDARILDLVTPIMIDECYHDRSAKFSLFKMAFNFSHDHIYNERLLMYLYDVTCSNIKFRIATGPRTIYSLFANLRLPFIDYQLLAKLLFFDNFIELEKAQDTRTIGLMTLCDLILTDIVFDDRQFDRLDALITRSLNGYQSLRQFKINHLNQIALAIVYLKLFSPLDEESKIRIGSKMKEWLHLIKTVKRPKKYAERFAHSQLLQYSSLSNGVFLGTVAVYDESIGDLISLDRYKDYVDRIDEMPLTENQKLIAFPRRRKLKGDISRQYETNYNYCLKKVLHHHNIEPIDVYAEELTKAGANPLSYLAEKVLRQLHD